MEREAAKRAKIRVASAKWDLNVAILMISVLVCVIILTYYDIGVEIVALVAIFGLAMVWLVGWRRGKRLYQRFYDEELSNLAQRLIERGMLLRREHDRREDSEGAT